jgi:antitoxin HicB
MSKTVDYYMSLPYPILLTPLSEEDGGGWLAEIPLLPNCISDGETEAEALVNVRDAMRGWLSVRIKHGDPIPEPESITA